MAPMLFAKAIMEEKPIKVFNNGDMKRDFTYIDDIVRGIVSLINCIPNKQTTVPFYQVLNIGNSQPADLMSFINILEKKIGKKTILDMYPMQDGDVKVTYADTSKISQLTSYKPTTDLDNGIGKFISWYNKYFS